MPPPPVPLPPAPLPRAAICVLAAGVAAALHIGKLPPALPALQAELGLDLLHAGLLLSAVQIAGMLLGLVAGLLADVAGLRRTMLWGLALLTAASWAGSLAAGDLLPRVLGPGVTPAGWMLAWRTVEGVGFLLAVTPGPGLLRRLVPPGREKTAMGLWGAYMPFGVALALLAGPWCVAHAGWAPWWQATAGVSALAALLVARAVPRPALSARAAEAPPPGASAAGVEGWPHLLATTVRAPGPWLAALSFACYSGQWLAVIGFLPTISAQAGIGPGATAAFAAFAALCNMVGNVVTGRLLQRGTRPATLLRAGFAVMGIGAIAAFAGDAQAAWLPLPARYAAVCLLSFAGGAIPATLFALSARLAPEPRMASTTIGLLQQLTAAGQFLGPPAVAWVAQRVGGWHLSWWVTTLCALAGLALSGPLARRAAGVRP